MKYNSSPTEEEIREYEANSEEIEGYDSPTEEEIREGEKWAMEVAEEESKKTLKGLYDVIFSARNVAKAAAIIEVRAAINKAAFFKTYDKECILDELYKNCVTSIEENATSPNVAIKMCKFGGFGAKKGSTEEAYIESIASLAYCHCNHNTLKDVEMLSQEFIEAFTYYEIIEILNKRINEEVLKTQQEEEHKQQITIPEKALNWLQENGFIENATAKPLKWLKNRQLTRELLTHDKIRGNLSKAEVERQTPNIFTDVNNNPLTLSNNKTVPSTDSDKLSNFLATL